MILSRIVSLFLRFGELASGAVVLGLMARFLHEYDRTRLGPEAREIYTIIIATLSVIFSLIWLIPTTHSFLHYPSDFFLSAAWFAAFGILVNWIHRINCGSAFYWGQIRGWDQCGKWKAAEAFSFISAIFWLASSLLGVYVYHKLSDRSIATDGTTRRRRWHRSRV